MATNQFYPVATGDGANVLTPASWSAAAVRQSGFQSGVAPSTACNTAWRQSSSVASMIGAFIASQGYDALDDGNGANLLNNFISAIGTITGGAYPTNAFVHGGLDTSTNANQINIPSLSPPITGFANFQLFEIVPNVAITGATSVTIGNLAAVQLTRRDGSALQAGDGPAGQPFVAIYFNNALRCLSFVRSDLGSATSTVITNNKVVGGRLAVFTATGAWSLTLPSDVTVFECEVWGGGGGGGGANSLTAAASGGGGGDYERGVYNCPAGTTLSGQVGAGGAGGAAGGGQGASGGLSSVLVNGSALISALGGAGAAGSTNGGNNSGANGGTGTGGIIQRPGGGGGFPYFVSDGTTTRGIGGAGGSAYTASGTPPNLGANGNSGSFPAGGGSGSSANAVGGPGGNGLVIIRY